MEASRFGISILGAFSEDTKVSISNIELTDSVTVFFTSRVSSLTSGFPTRASEKLLLAGDERRIALLN
jgi:hypothetical protein